MQPVVKERPITLYDFDELIYEDQNLYQLFKNQRFLHQLSEDGFPVEGLVQKFYCAVVTASKGDEMQRTMRDYQVPFLPNFIVVYLRCERPSAPCFPGTPLAEEEETSKQDL